MTAIQPESTTGQLTREPVWPGMGKSSMTEPRESSGTTSLETWLRSQEDDFAAHPDPSILMAVLSGDATAHDTQRVKQHIEQDGCLRCRGVRDAYISHSELYEDMVDNDF